MILAVPSPPEPVPPSDALFCVEADIHYAVVDVETTGLDARVHRVVECAIVELDGSGRIVDEWVSLVTIPGSDEPGAAFIHGITRSMLRGAPEFAALVPEILVRLTGRLVAGHFLAFDAGHLAAEFRRSGEELPDVATAGLCTRELSRRHLPPARRSLEVCCAAAGIRIVDAHTALGDARAAAGLLGWFITQGHDRLWADRVLAARSLEWPPGPCAGERRWSAGWPRRTPEHRPSELEMRP